MSAMAEKARSKAKEKVERLTRSATGKIDASGWREPGGEDAGVQTGPRPISRRQFKKGGKVSGDAPATRADRKPRKGNKAYIHATDAGLKHGFHSAKSTGGRTAKKDGGALTATSLINRDVKQANESRAGTKHIGGMKKGGRAHKMVGGPMMGRPGMPVSAPMATAGRAQPMPMRPGMRPYKKGGKVEHGRDCKCCGGGAFADGGKVKSEFAANKAMAQPKGASGTDYYSHVGRLGMKGPEPKTVGMATRPMWSAIKGKKAGGSVSDGSLEGTRPQGGRLARKSGGAAKKGTNINIIIAPGGGQKPAMPMPAMPPPGGPVGLHQGAPPMPPPGAAPPMAPPPQMRKRGGRTGYPIDAGGGSGLGRLEKARAYGG